MNFLRISENVRWILSEFRRTSRVFSPEMGESYHQKQRGYPLSPPFAPPLLSYNMVSIITTTWDFFLHLFKIRNFLFRELEEKEYKETLFFSSETKFLFRLAFWFLISSEIFDISYTIHHCLIVTTNINTLYFMRHFLFCFKMIIKCA